jgi:hypothetical protein
MSLCLASTAICALYPTIIPCAAGKVADRLRILRGKGLPASVRSKTRTLASLEPLD